MNRPRLDCSEMCFPACKKSPGADFVLNCILFLLCETEVRLRFDEFESLLFVFASSSFFLLLCLRSAGIGAVSGVGDMSMGKMGEWLCGVRLYQSESFLLSFRGECASESESDEEV